MEPMSLDVDENLYIFVHTCANGTVQLAFVVQVITIIILSVYHVCIRCLVLGQNMHKASCK